MTRLPLYLGQEHACGYLAGWTARMACVPPDWPMTSRLFSQLVANGFRRSGDLVYRPWCDGCAACVPVRIPVETFQPNRSQRRIAKRNADVRVREKPAEFDAAHYRLYCRYLQARHPDSEMGQAGPEDYLQFLGNQRFEGTRFCEFSEAGRLLAVAVLDELDDGWAAGYTFYEPGEERRGVGTFAVLWQIAEARRRGLHYVYLGFWVAESRKMAYKAGFRPIERFTGSGWIELDRPESASP
jgi:leucyl-tRNA---protein transferase